MGELVWGQLESIFWGAKYVALIHSLKVVVVETRYLYVSKLPVTPAPVSASRLQSVRTTCVDHYAQFGISFKCIFF